MLQVMYLPELRPQVVGNWTNAGLPDSGRFAELGSGSVAISPQEIFTSGLSLYLS